MPRPIAEIDADIGATRSAITAALTAQSYSLGGQTVQRARLGELREHLAGLLAEQEAAEAAASGEPSIQAVPTMRGW
jgi:hypothetical protein